MTLSHWPTYYLYMDITELAPLDLNNGCSCITCLGAPWSSTVCSAVVSKARRDATAENERMLAETGRNFEQEPPRAALDTQPLTRVESHMVMADLPAAAPVTRQRYSDKRECESETGAARPSASTVSHEREPRR